MLTEKLQSAELPASSVKVYETKVGPTMKNAPGTCDLSIVSEVSRLSVAVGSDQETKSPAAPFGICLNMSVGQLLMTGLVVSSTTVAAEGKRYPIVISCADMKFTAV